MSWRRTAPGWLVLLLALELVAGAADAYPLDGDVYTGIVRLRGYRELQHLLLARGTLHPGALLGLDRIGLALAERPELQLPAPEASLSRQLAALLGAQADRYSISVVDLSNPAAIRYLAHRDELHQNPGSVGKLLVALAWFQELADRFPDDVEARARLLRDTEVQADAVIQVDSHEVPFWRPGDERITKRPLREGDRGNLFSYLDWMLSSSSNAAASVLLQQLVLFRHFGADYDPSAEALAGYLASTPIATRTQTLKDLLLSPLARNGLDPQTLRQGGMFTREGKRRIPGGDSSATTRALATFLLKLEQGVLVDAWSSLELKRLLYLTDRRIRYASHPALSEAAVFFKSGSLYSCVPEADFVCGKYRGNALNFMNSVAIVESEEGGRKLHYLVAVLSNVLRENSAVAHQTLALRIHRLLQSRNASAAPLPAP